MVRRIARSRVMSSVSRDPAATRKMSARSVCCLLVSSRSMSSFRRGSATKLPGFFVLNKSVGELPLLRWVCRNDALAPDEALSMIALSSRSISGSGSGSGSLISTTNCLSGSGSGSGPSCGSGSGCSSSKRCRCAHATAAALSRSRSKRGERTCELEGSGSGCGSASAGSRPTCCAAARASRSALRRSSQRAVSSTPSSTRAAIRSSSAFGGGGASPPRPRPRRGYAGDAHRGVGGNPTTIIDLPLFHHRRSCPRQAQRCWDATRARHASRQTGR